MRVGRESGRIGEALHAKERVVVLRYLHVHVDRLEERFAACMLTLMDTRVATYARSTRT